MPLSGRKTENFSKNKVGSRSQRIKIPQPAKHPFHVHGQRQLKENEIHQSPPWYIEHRRGPRRLAAGEDPNEMRAISKYAVRGTLPERIVYQALLNMHYVVGCDFTFQSSLEGGRLELGGVVADFLLPIQRLCIQVQGPTHTQHIQIAKDEEQRMILEAYGYSVVYLDQDVILDPYRFEDAWRGIFNLAPVWGGGNQDTYGMADMVDGYDGRWKTLTDLAWQCLQNMWAANARAGGVS